MNSNPNGPKRNIDQIQDRFVNTNDAKIQKYNTEDIFRQHPSPRGNFVDNNSNNVIIALKGEINKSGNNQRTGVLQQPSQSSNSFTKNESPGSGFISNHTQKSPNQGAYNTGTQSYKFPENHNNNKNAIPTKSKNDRNGAGAYHSATGDQIQSDRFKENQAAIIAQINFCRFLYKLAKLTEEKAVLQTPFL